MSARSHRRSAAPLEARSSVPDVIARLFQYIDARDWNRLGELLHDNMVYERPGYEPLNGRERVLHFYREERIIVSGVHAIEGLIADGDAAAAWGSFRGYAKDGRPLSVRFVDIYRFEQDVLRTRTSYFFTPTV